MSYTNRLFPLGIINVIIAGFALIGVAIMMMGMSALLYDVSYGGVDSMAATIVLVLVITSALGTLLLLVTGILQIMRKRAGAVCGVIYGALSLAGLIVSLLVLFSLNVPMHPGALAGIPLSILLPVANIIVCIGVLNGPVAAASTGSAPIPSAMYTSPIHQDSGHTAVYTEQGPTILVQIRVRGENHDPYTLAMTDHLRNPLKNRIGRNADCEASIPQDFTVSGEHCELFLNHTGGVMVHDLNSTHGTYVLRNKNKIQVRQPIQVYDGERIQLGQFTVLTLSFRNFKVA